MKVQEVDIGGHRKRYLLTDHSGCPIIPIAQYLKHLDNTGKSPNTQRTYCYALKQYYEFLEAWGLALESIGLAELSEFMAWLRFPQVRHNATYFTAPTPLRCEKTSNLMLSVVCGYYGFLYRSGKLAHNPNDNLARLVFGGNRKYKDFLFHITKNHPQVQNHLKLKEPKERIRALTHEDVQSIYAAANNRRDRFLVQLLYETGLRIGEALSLWVCDFEHNHRFGHRIILKARGEHVNGARLKTGGRDIHISQSLMDAFDDYLYGVLDELGIAENHLFVKLKGQHKGQALTYTDVAAVFRTLSSKSGLHISPHMLRHAHATRFYAQTKNIKQVQERLGHAQVQTTLAMYLHPSDDEIRQSWDIAQPAFVLHGDDQ